MTEPVAVGVERFFEFIERPGLSVLLVSVHPRHTFSAALSQQLDRDDHGHRAGHDQPRRAAVTGGGPALPFLHQRFRACDASQFGVLPGYCLFREAEMLAWDAGLPALADVSAIAQSALLGVVFSSLMSDLLFVVSALRLAADQVAAPRVALKFKQVAAGRTRRQAGAASAPPPIDEVRWAYETLAVAPSATDREVHQAWRRRRVEMHPDVAAGDPAEFERRSRISADINRARDIIVSHRARGGGAAEARAA